MSEKPKKLTPEDPVPKETLANLKELSQARASLAGELLDIEQERVRILAAAHQIDTQTTRVFEKINMDRGLPPASHISIDPETGVITIGKPEQLQSVQE